MVIDPGEPEILERLAAQLSQQACFGVGRRHRAGPDVIEQRANLGWSHSAVMPVEN
jgi:hypothetical protein